MRDALAADLELKVIKAAAKAPRPREAAFLAMLDFQCSQVISPPAVHGGIRLGPRHSAPRPQHRAGRLRRLLLRQEASLVPFDDRGRVGGILSPRRCHCDDSLSVPG